MEVCCSGARFTKQYNEPEKTLFPSCIRRFVCEWTEVSRHASRVWFVQCHHPLLQPPFVTHTVIFYIVFHAFSVLIGQKGCTAQDGEGKWKSPSAGSFKYLRERATSWAGNRKYIHLTWFPVKSEHFQNLITNGKKRLGVGMTTAPRGRSLTRSLPVERDSILDGSCCASAAFQLFINLFVDKKRNKKNRMCHFFLPECAIQAVSREGATTLPSL